MYVGVGGLEGGIDNAVEVGHNHSYIQWKLEVKCNVPEFSESMHTFNFGISNFFLFIFLMLIPLFLLLLEIQN